MPPQRWRSSAAKPPAAADSLRPRAGAVGEGTPRVGPTGDVPAEGTRRRLGGRAKRGGAQPAGGAPLVRQDPSAAHEESPDAKEWTREGPPFRAGPLAFAVGT